MNHDKLYSAIRDWLLKLNSGIEVHLEGGGAAPTFLAITLSPAAQDGAAKDTRVAIYANVNETWTADLYESLDAIYNGQQPLSSHETKLPSSSTNERLIALAFLLKMNDICIAGHRAWFGRCDVADCPCHPSPAEEAQASVVQLQHAINYVNEDGDAVFILASAICDIATEAAERGVIVDPLKGSSDPVATHRVVTEEELAAEREALSPAERDELDQLDDDPIRDHRERNICEGCGEYNVNCTCEDNDA